MPYIRILARSYDEVARHFHFGSRLAEAEHAALLLGADGIDDKAVTLGVPQGSGLAQELAALVHAQARLKGRELDRLAVLLEALAEVPWRRSGFCRGSGLLGRSLRGVL